MADGIKTRGATHVRRMARGADEGPARKGPPLKPADDMSGFASLGWSVGAMMAAREKGRG